jgi:hypothetical protein
MIAAAVQQALDALAEQRLVERIVLAIGTVVYGRLAVDGLQRAGHSGRL